MGKIGIEIIVIIIISSLKNNNNNRVKIYKVQMTAAVESNHEL